MQLDLFDSPFPPMNPNKNPMAPDCFRDYKQYSEWLGLARAAKEQCHICEDCTHEYKLKMLSEHRCHEQWNSIQIVMQKKVAPLFGPSKKPQEMQIDPLNWK